MSFIDYLLNGFVSVIALQFTISKYSNLDFLVFSFSFFIDAFIMTKGLFSVVWFKKELKSERLAVK